MQTFTFHGCNENPSYFSAKCSECRFSCLKDSNGTPQTASSAQGSSLSIPGVAAVVAGAAVSVAGYPAMSAGLTVMGAAAIIGKILRK